MADLTNLPTEPLEALLEFERDAVAAVPAALAERLHTDDAGVADGLSRLRDVGAVTIATDGAASLTESGRHLAVAAARRHALVERLLRDVLRVPWSRVHHEAERWEGVISDEVEARLVDLLGDPGTCPHGNPIPGSANLPDLSDAVCLADCPPGPAEVVRIAESLEADADALWLLDDAGVTPGRDVEVRAHASDGSVSVAGGTADALLPPHVARSTFVRRR